MGHAALRQQARVRPTCTPHIPHSPHSDRVPPHFSQRRASMPVGGDGLTRFLPTSAQLVDSTVPPDSVCRKGEREGEAMECCACLRAF